MSYLKLRPDRVAMQDATAQVIRSLRGMLTGMILLIPKYYFTAVNLSR